METILLGPANYFFLFLPTIIFSFLILVAGVSVFSYVFVIRLAPLIRSNSSGNINDFFKRFKNFFKIWFMQARHPRYMFAGFIHIVIFFGFIILSFSTISMVIVGFSSEFVLFDGLLGEVYDVLKHYSSTLVLIACVLAMIRRYILKPKRYEVNVNSGVKEHKVEALFVLLLISLLMLTDSFFEASKIVANSRYSLEISYLPPLSLVWFLAKLLSSATIDNLQNIHIFSYYLHDILFFFFLCFLPFGKHFHVITSLFNVFLMRVYKGKIKPVKFGVKEEDLDEIDYFGVKKIEDFTWKHLLDFYSCADCGRCSDNCPAYAVGRPLSPRLISIKARELIFKNYPVYPYGSPFLSSQDLIDTIYTEDEIWSCTTCGACEEECPIGIEYIDKIVDLRRGVVDEGRVPQSLQKPLRAIEKRGNPWGKLEKKRTEWVNNVSKEINIKLLNSKVNADLLYFVDSITSYDDRMQKIAESTVKILSKLKVDFGILGGLEKDSGNEVRRFGEEMLFQLLKETNSKNILNSSVKEIVTSDPHSFNVLKNEYSNLPKVRHLSQFLFDYLKLGKLFFVDSQSVSDKIYTYHDPCYLGRHNDIYVHPREVINSINGLNYVEMKRSKDRSFCCGGGGLMLFYEPNEEERMGVLRVKMAAEIGANVIITACPYCLLNIEDAIKVSGLEGKMEVIDFAELVSSNL